MSENFVDIVSDINFLLEDQFQELIYEYGMGCEYSTSGYQGLIKFLGVVIWDSDNTCDMLCDEETEEYLETIEQYVRRKINKLIKDLQVIEL